MVATCHQWQDHPKDPLKKINSCEQNGNVHNHWHGRTKGGGDRVKAQFPCIFARDLETPWYIGECRATSCLSCSSTLSKQFPRFHSNYTANVVFQGQDMARFLHLSSRTSSERAQELPTVPIFVTEIVHLGSERNRAIPTKWRTGSSRRCVGGSRHMVDWTCVGRW